MLNHFHFYNGMITEPTVTEFIKWNHYTLAVLHQDTFTTSIGVPPTPTPTPFHSLDVNAESLFQPLSRYPRTCRRCRECVWSPTSAALVITALVMSDDQRVTGNNTFKEKRVLARSRKFYTHAEKRSCWDCCYKGLIIYLTRMLRKRHWSEKKEKKRFHLGLPFVWLAVSSAAASLNRDTSRRVASCFGDSSFQHHRQLQHMPPQQTAAALFQVVFPFK